MLICQTDDWRLTGQESYLRGKTLCRRSWRAHSPQWDHDHCEFCWQKFSAADGDAHEGYATEDGCHWICPVCFRDFRAMFEWTVAGENGGVFPPETDEVEQLGVGREGGRA